jgi:2-oxoglutarate dehydrogenase E2 component (dihydrolipoamide succinyltransferase)
MSVSVSMPQLGESVTEGTVTRWLKHEGDYVTADEPLLEVSTDKVDTEIPSPVSGTLRGITVAEDETVAVGAELAVIDEDGAAPVAEAAEVGAQQPAEPARPYEPQVGYGQAPAAAEQAPYEAPGFGQAPPRAPYEQRPYERLPDAGTGYEAPPVYAEPVEPAPQQPPAYQPYAERPGGYQAPPPPPPPVPPAPQPTPPPPPAPEAPPAAPYQPAHAETAPPVSYAPPPYEPAYAEPEPLTPANGAESPYVTPLVRKLAAEHDIDLGSITGTGVGGRIRKQDVLDAARQRRGGEPPKPAPAAAQPQQVAAPAVQPAAPAVQPAAPAVQPAAPGAKPAQAPAGPAAPVTIPAPSSLRGTTERLSRARQLIAQRMVESLQTSAQLTTVVEADVTAIARLRERIKVAFEAREGVKLSFLPFFALATVEALKAHPKLNAIIDTANGTVTYHDAEHLGIAVDTERGLMVPVIRNAGDLNIGGLARKIADLAQRTRAGHVSPDDLTGGTFTLTNTGSRGALFDTPIINQPQVAILGTGTVNKRAVVVDDPDLGEVITVRSVVYLALTYDHRLVDGADAARFLVTIKNRLEEGAFEAEFGQ